MDFLLFRVGLIILGFGLILLILALERSRYNKRRMKMIEVFKTQPVQKIADVEKQPGSFDAKIVGKIAAITPIWLNVGRAKFYAASFLVEDDTGKIEVRAYEDVGRHWLLGRKVGEELEVAGKVMDSSAWVKPDLPWSSTTGKGRVYDTPKVIRATDLYYLQDHVEYQTVMIRRSITLFAAVGVILAIIGVAVLFSSVW
ncbi:hypothetical protein KEJ26_07325 [Candidatus Bathyarchaeota archaeon]|nr:hypothetical protein [Candidatus Bathyarchaeota archaeon]